MAGVLSRSAGKKVGHGHWQRMHCPVAYATDLVSFCELIERKKGSRRTQPMSAVAASLSTGVLTARMGTTCTSSTCSAAGGTPLLRTLAQRRDLAGHAFRAASTQQEHCRRRQRRGQALRVAAAEMEAVEASAPRPAAGALVPDRPGYRSFQLVREPSDAMCGVCALVTARVLGGTSLLQICWNRD